MGFKKPKMLLTSLAARVKILFDYYNLNKIKTYNFFKKPETKLTLHLRLTPQ